MRRVSGSSTSRLRWGLELGGALVAALGVVCLWDFTVDDAFITFRYAKHAAMGLGPVWNLEGPRVEGYSNALWMWGLALGAWAGANVEVLAKIMGLVAFVATGQLLGRTVGRWTRSELAVAVTFFAWCLNPMAWVHSVSGLETSVYALCVVALAVGALEGRALVLAGAGVAAVLFRPDGVVPAGLALAMAWRAFPQHRRAFTQAAGMIFAAGAALLAFRVGYYGAPLPNPYLLKSGDFAGGLRWFAALLPVLAALGALGWAVWKAAPERRSTLIGVSVFVAALTVPFVGAHHVMDFGQRFFFPCTALLMLVLGLFVAHAPAKLRRLTPVAVAALVGWGAWETGPYVRDYPLVHHVYRRLGEVLATWDRGEASATLAMGDAGLVPFLTDWNTLDLYGLNDRGVATGDDRTERFSAARPTVAIVYSADGNRNDRPHGMEAYNPRGLEQAYTPLGKFFVREYFLQVWVRSDVPEANRAALAASLQPEAIAAFKSLKSQTGWSEFFSRVWRRVSGRMTRPSP